MADNDKRMATMKDRRSARRFLIFGASTFLSDIFDLIHINDGRVYKIFQNVKEIRNERVLSIEERIALLGYPVELFDSLERFRPEDDCKYTLGFTAVQKDVLINTLKFQHKIVMSKLIHPGVSIGSHVHIGEGVFVNSQVVIAPNAVLDDYCVINRAVSIGHDAKIGKFTRIGPSVAIAGSTKIGEKCSIGIGACVLDRVHIGDCSVVGAGSVVTKDLPGGVVAYGIPAKVVRTNVLGSSAGC